MVANQMVLDRINLSHLILLALIVLVILAVLVVLWGDWTASPDVGEYIVQADDMATAAALVEYVGGEVTRDLGGINAVGARLTTRQLARLGSSNFPVRIYENSAVQVDGAQSSDSRNAVSLP